MTAMFDLFDSIMPPGLSVSDAMITPRDEAELIGHIDRAGLTPFRFQQWTGKRLTQSFGWNYDFTNGAFEAADPIPDWLLPVQTDHKNEAPPSGDGGTSMGAERIVRGAS